MTDTQATAKHLRRVIAALALREIPDFDAALDQLLQAQEEAPRDVDVLLALGLTYQDLNQSQPAEDSLRVALGLAPDDERVRAALAGLLTSQHKYDEAISLLKPVIERGTYSSDIWYQYANATLQGDEGNAFAHLLQEASTVFASDPPSPIVEQLWQARAERTDAWRAAAEALKIAEEGLHFLPKNKALRKLQAQALVYLGRYEEGLKAIEKLQGDAENGLLSEEYLARLGVGQTYDASALAARHGGKEIAFFSSAIVLFQYGKLGAAATAAEAALKYERSQLVEEFPLDLGLILAHAGKSDAARQVVEDVLAGDLGNYDDKESLDWHLDLIGLPIYAECVLATDALVQSRYEEAISRFNDVVSNQKLHASVVWPLPVICCYDGRLAPPFVTPYQTEASVLRTVRANLATAHCLAGNVGEALAAAQLAVQTEPDYPELAKEDAPYASVAYAVLGCVHLAAGNIESAREAWHEALNIIGDKSDLKQAATLIHSWLDARDDDAEPHN